MTEETPRLQLSLAKWQPANAFLFGGKDGSRRKPGLANKVDGEQVRIYIRESLPWQPLRCELVYCLGGRVFLLRVLMASFLITFRRCFGCLE